MIHPKDNEKQALISAAQDLTANWADLGQVIDCKDITNFGLWLNIDINDSTGVVFRVIPMKDSSDTDEYSSVIEDSSSGTATLVAPQLYDLESDADQKIVLQIDVTDIVPYAKVQVKAGTVGATAGQVDEAYVTFKDREIG